LLLADIAGEIETNFRGTGLDFYRIRPYEATDGARMVDWKSTAHTSNLQVREFSRERQRTVEIYLDRRVPPGGNDWFEGTRFESAVERCALLAWHLAERDIDLWLRSQGFSCAVPDVGEVYDVLRFLALVQPIIAPPVMENTSDRPAEPPLDATSVRIVFSARPAEFESEGWIAGG